MPNFSKINASKIVPYIHLSKTHGGHEMVQVSRTEAANLRFQSLNVNSLRVNVRALESLRIVMRGLNSIGLTDGRGLIRGNIIVKDHAPLIYKKFSGIIPDLKLEDLTKNSSDHSQKCFSNFVSVLENNLVRLEGTPWIEMTKGSEPLKTAGEGTVKNHITGERKKSVVLTAAGYVFTGIASAALSWLGWIGLEHTVILTGGVGTAMACYHVSNLFNFSGMLREFDRD